MEDKIGHRISVAVIAFLRWFCPDHLLEEIEGDLIQRFEGDLKRFGLRKARRRYVWNAIRFFRPGIVFRNRFSPTLTQFYMLPHFLKIFCRTAFKHSIYSFINISGLVIAMTACAFIALYVWNERSYDNFHANGDRIFRIRQDRYTNGALTRQWTAGPWGIGRDLKANFPEVLRYVCVNRGGEESTVLANGDVFFSEDKVFYASEDFFRVFSYPLIKGVDSLVLRDPFTMVVSESLARRYFGNADPIGRILKSNGREEYRITGVFKDVPENTHLKFDALFSFESLLKILGPEETQDLMSNWGWAGNYTYIELAPGTTAEMLQAKLPPFVEKQAGDVLRSWGEDMVFVLQPLTSIHLYSDFKDELEPGGNGRAMNFLVIIAAIILVMAWINYMNLATARSLERAREVGVRKVLGSNRGLLIRQFLLEAFGINAIALLVTAICVMLLSPYFVTFFDKRIDFSLLLSGKAAYLLAMVFLLGVIGSGFYPAFLLSGFRPVNILKGTIHTSSYRNNLRKGLVIVQFASSVLLITGTLAVYQQLEFMQNSSLGMDPDQVMVIKGPNATDSTYSSRLHGFCESLRQYAGITAITASSDIPGQSVRASNGGVRLVGQDIKSGNSFRVVMADDDYVEAFGLTLLDGRNFSKKFNDHWKSALVNETAMKLLGFSHPGEVIGQKIYLWDNVVEIVGVVQDYHQESLRKRIDQLIFVCDREAQTYYSIKINTKSSVDEIVSRAKTVYGKAFPGNPFHFFFMDDHFNRQYRADRQFGEIVGLFTVVSLVIACLGLFGLSSYAVVQRTKEIGIRKVLGASAAQISALLSKEFALIVILAIIIGWATAYWVVDQWLSEFAYRITPGFTMYLVPGLAIFIVTLLTVLFQAIRAALADPVRSLRTE